MAGIITIPVVQISGGFYAPDNSVADPKIKHLASGVFYTGSLIGTTGRYKFTNGGAGCPDGYYVFYDGATAKDAVLGSVAEGGTWYGDGSLDYLPLNGSDWDAGSKKIINVTDPTTATGALNRQTGDARYLLASILSTLMDLTSNQTASGTKTFNILKIAQLGDDLSLAGYKIDGGVMDDDDIGSTLTTKTFTDSKYETLTGGAGKYPSKIAGANEQIYADWVFRAVPFLLIPPTAPYHLSTVKFVRDYVNTVLAGITSGDITAYQQAENILRGLFSGTDEAGRVYTTVEALKNYAESYASAERIILITFEGGENVTPNYNLLPDGTLAEFVHYAGAHRGIIIKLESGGSYTGANTDNKTIFYNHTLATENSADTATFTDCIFIDCNFANLAEDGVFNFEDCNFYGLNNFEKGCSYSFTDCKGQIYDVDNDRYVYTGSTIYAGTSTHYEALTADGDLRGRRILGRQGTDVASASTITLGDGNQFTVTGTTTINLMSATGWTAGSRVTIQFQSNITVNHLSAPSGANACFNWKSGANKSITAGQIFSFILSWDLQYWSEN